MNDGTVEIWKDVPGYENKYQASNSGKIRSVDHVVERNMRSGFPVKGRELKPRITLKGYAAVRLNGKFFSLHRVIAMTFLPNPENKPQVNHKDGNKLNNLVSNLEWSTQSENQLHAHRTGLKDFKGSRNSRALVTEEDVKWIRLHKGVLTRSEIREKFPQLSDSAFEKIFNYRNWRHVI